MICSCANRKCGKTIAHGKNSYEASLMHRVYSGGVLKLYCPPKHMLNEAYEKYSTIFKNKLSECKEDSPEEKELTRRVQVFSELFETFSQHDQHGCYYRSLSHDTGNDEMNSKNKSARHSYWERELKHHVKKKVKTMKVGRSLSSWADRSDEEDISDYEDQVM